MQPSFLANGTVLKDYQMYGLNWLKLLYVHNWGCILADDMGLGKTLQVISFFAHLQEQGNKGPHLVVVPPTALDNWLAEFRRFAPTISVVTYSGPKALRYQLRQTLIKEQANTSRIGGGWEVLITTYSMVQQDSEDRKFFRNLKWNASVFDEGHLLKNMESKRYTHLIRYPSQWRLLLTGTPIQNNLQELVSLMNFILSNHFGNAVDSLHALFDMKDASQTSLLANKHVSKAKRIIAPFVLRRYKEQVERELPRKTERIEWCELTDKQEAVYGMMCQQSLGEQDPNALQSNGPVRDAETADEICRRHGSNGHMNLRKASLHPMLFRVHFTDDILAMASELLLTNVKFPSKQMSSNSLEDKLWEMTDAQLQKFFKRYKVTRPFIQDNSCYYDSGKVIALLKLLSVYIKENRKILVFSQFTTVIDILEVILREKKIGHLILTGSTGTGDRQGLVNKFSADPKMEYPVFLLSTKAGGFGINLTAASVVIIFDQDFNPQNDRQAQDRAYRIGQKREVDVIKLITKGTIEESMLRVAQEKLALDNALTRAKVS